MTDSPEDILHPRRTMSLNGHEEAERLFLDAFNEDRLHHAWLVTGPKGVGKSSFAWRAAKFLMVHGQQKVGGDSLFGDALPPVVLSTLSVDADHDTVTRILAGTHSDINEIMRSPNKDTGKMRKEIVIDDIRALINQSTQTSSEGGWRIAIIDSVDELNVSAANALLKLLEEPPVKTILFLVSHSPGKLLPTIRSRCRALKLQPLPIESVKAVLAGKYPSLSVEEMNALSVLSEGAPGQACSYAASNALSLYQDIMNILGQFPRIDVPALHKFAEKLASVKADADYHLFVDLLYFIRQRLLRYMATGEEVTPVSSNEIAIFHDISSKSTLDQQLDLWEKTIELIGRASRVNLDRKQVILNIFSQMAALVSR
ncbi:DNA polymerase III subunit delta' [Temperatibacter marinus]|uniref:DNA polymerase III subunit delta n=1 Tax=Temperatibacter marinus TaxID=1456591 RepID=A0AA52H8M0_9PROT|nr:DNA polymerase III subunit delta' [Temperatibacter marinus]WND02256.1 DNA polymerase III subunit delta' [Temperatibacter marinus]